MKLIRLTILALFFTIPSFAITITGDSVVCVGNSITLTAAGGITTLGTWSSSNPAVATATGMPGIGTVTGVSAGVVTITYTSGTSVVTKSVTVDPVVSPISGPTTICAGGTAILMDTTPGGTWSSATTTVATIGSTGLVTGVASGTSAISYTVSPGCKAGVTVTVNSAPPITGPTEICAGSTATLSDALIGGTWSSSSPGVATIGSSTGIVAGVGVGTATITYTVPAGCTALLVITVVSTPAPISGPSTVCQGSTITLTDVGGGNWSSSNPAVASVVSSTGIVTGVAGGTVNITYTLGAGCSVTKPVTVNPMPVCAVTGGGSYCSGDTGVHIGLACSGVGFNYQLYRGGTPVGVSISGTGSALDMGLYTSAGTYTIVAMNGTTGCTATMTGSVVITVNPTPGPITGNSEVCIGYNITLADTSSGGSWSSSVPAKATIGSSTGIVTGVAGGTTIISYTIPGTGCYVVKSVTVGTLPCSTGITLVANNAGEVALYPNPASDELSLTLNKGAYSSYYITNEVGQLLLQGQLDNSISKVDIRELPAALYMIILKGDYGYKMMKFLKM